MNLFLCLYDLLCIIILPCATNMVMGVFFIFVLCNICHLLTFLPLSIHKGGEDEVNDFNVLKHQCKAYVASWWLTLISFLSHNYF